MNNNKIEHHNKIDEINTITSIENMIELPTGKPHVSFSEIKTWKECSYRHKLQFIDKLTLDKPGIHMDFGTAIHAACEVFLKTRIMDKKVFLRKLHELWTLHQLVSPTEYTVDLFKQFAEEGSVILDEIPVWFDATFPNWECIDAEHALYEQIDSHPHAFKGFIDCIISVVDKKNKKITWVLDFKTTSRGWFREKRTDELVKTQLTLYKNFWSKKTGTDPKNVRCGFILLKRSKRKNVTKKFL
jgi:hypothetical protein